MASTNHERVTLAMEALKAGLAPFVGRECVRVYHGRFVQEIQNITGTKIDAKNKLAELESVREMVGGIVCRREHPDDWGQTRCALWLRGGVGRVAHGRRRRP